MSTDTKLMAPAAWSPRGWPSERPFTTDSPEAWVYTPRYSYLPGETVDLHISTTASEFELEVIRDGAQPEVVHRAHGLSGMRQETPADAYAVGCGWEPTHRWSIPGDARAGFYLIIVRNHTPTGEVWEREHFIIVKHAATHRAPIALILTTGTLNAYNDWGGANQYRGIGDDPRNEIGSPLSSTQRPIARGMLRKPPGVPQEFHSHTPPIGAAPQYPAYEWARLNGYSRHHADAFWATYERDFVIWAERQGYELDYLTQIDLHEDQTALDAYDCAVVVGHDEYWSWQMRDVIDAFVERGGGFARFAGNYQWQVRLSDDGTTQYCYRLPALDPASDTTPHLTTTVWEARSVGRPGAATVGLNGLGGTLTRYGVAAPRSSGGFTVYRPDHWAFAGTDLYYGDLLGGAPAFLATFEVDGVEYSFRRGLPFPTFEDGAPETLEILAICPAVKGEEDRFNGTLPLGSSDSGIQELFEALGDELPDYVRENQSRGSGMIATFTRGAGEVFNGGSTQWPHALSTGDPFVSQVVRNVLDRFTGRTTKAI
ncbi:N,N-dimethylformamidase beta subunit family domain-containing protein [Ruicaihuangia caeni]|uniref:N,N-dimethylformamidase beta subunit family domain-containing protein n=1 Tax=Ruicaihuangia caeni TaxID=3042517 RepID=UPI0033904CF3